MHVMHVSMLKITLEKAQENDLSIGSVILDFSNLIFSNKLCYAIFGNYNYDLKLRVQCYLIILSKN